MPPKKLGASRHCASSSGTTFVGPQLMASSQESQEAKRMDGVKIFTGIRGELSLSKSQSQGIDHNHAHI
jgi:hypothetical protein